MPAMGLIGGIARTAVTAATWTAVSNTVSKHQAGRWAAQSQSPSGGYRPPPPGRYQRPMFQEPARRHAAEYAAAQQRQQVAMAPPPGPAAPPAPPAPPAPAPVDGMSTKLAQLEQLGALKAQGILTEAEFEQQKRQILGSS